MPVDIKEYHKFLMAVDKDYAKANPEEQKAYLAHILPQSSSPLQQAFSKLAEPATQMAAKGISSVQPALGPLADLVSAGVEKAGGYEKGALRTPEARAGGLHAAQTTGARTAAETVVPQTPEEAALAIAIPGAGKLAQMIRPASKVLPSLARIGASGVAGAMNPSDPEMGALQSAGVSGALEALPGAVKMAKKLPGGGLAARLLKGAGSEVPMPPAIHQKAAFTPGHSIFDTATGKSIEIPAQPITFHGSQGPVTVKPPTGGQLPDVILEEKLQRAPKPLKQGARTIADWLANFAVAKRNEETGD